MLSTVTGGLRGRLVVDPMHMEHIHRSTDNAVGGHQAGTEQ